MENSESKQNIETPEDNITVDSSAPVKNNQKWYAKYSVPIIAIEAILLLIILLVFVNYARIEPPTPTQFADNAKIDEISWSDGILKVNNVNAQVPKGENVKYSISYSWAESDTDYPSVPKAVIASYESTSEKSADSSEEPTDNVLYDISLYKLSYHPESEIPSGKNAENWFSDWEESSSGETEKRKVNDNSVSAFIVSTLNSPGSLDEYRSYTCSFAVPEDDGLSIYNLEGTCYSQESIALFRKIMEASVESIKTDVSTS